MQNINIFVLNISATSKNREEQLVDFFLFHIENNVLTLAL